MFNIMRYMNDTDFQIVYYKNDLNIINYEKINYMEDEKISLSYINGTLLIKGDNLRVKKLLDNELILSGTVKTIELRNK